MRYKLFLVVLMSAFLFYPVSTSAFWPMDMMRRVTDRFRNPTPKLNQFEERVDNRLEQAVKDGKVTPEQETEIKTKLEAIKTKRQELLDLEKSFSDWLKANNLPATILNRPMMGRPASNSGMMRQRFEQESGDLNN